MKSIPRSSNSTSFTPLYRRQRRYRSILSLLTVLLFLPLFISCDQGGKNGKEEDELSSDSNIHMAFAGGGWRAYTGHSAFILSLLQNNNHELSKALANVETVSSNSGGSWFSTMLMYSDTFRNAIQATNALSMWDSTGWLGKQKTYFGSVSTDTTPSFLYFPSVSTVFTHGNEYHWNDVVVDLVFKGYTLDMSTTLSSSHLPWASNKNLLLAATMLTDNVVLNDTTYSWGLNHRYYQACLAPNSPSFNGGYGSSCSGNSSSNVTPITFPSLSNPSDSIPPFFSAATTDGINIGYTEDWEFSSKPAPTATTTIPKQLATDQVPVILAAASSSAALGFGASETVLAQEITVGTWDAAYALEDEALSFKISGNKLQFVEEAERAAMDLPTLKDNKVFRIADGGPVDNSGVAQLVSFLQLDKKAKANGFNIIAFDIMQDSCSTCNSAAIVGTDIANLFGRGGPFCVNGTNPLTKKEIRICVTTPHLQIFDTTALDTTKALWQYEDSGQVLVYTKYEVQTTNNPAFGISQGTTGTLHAFTCISPKANTAPLSYADFASYEELLDFINKGLTANDSCGLNLLEVALGLEASTGVPNCPPSH